MSEEGGADADADPAVLPEFHCVAETVTRAAALNTVRVLMLTNVSAHEAQVTVGFPSATEQNSNMESKL